MCLRPKSHSSATETTTIGNIASMFDDYSNPFFTVAIQQELTFISKKW